MNFTFLISLINKIFWAIFFVILLTASIYSFLQYLRNEKANEVIFVVISIDVTFHGLITLYLFW